MKCEQRATGLLRERVFAWTNHIPPGQVLRYLLVGGWNTLSGYGIYALFTALLMPRVHYGYIYASVLSSLVNITIAWLGYKLFVFKTRGNYLAEWSRCLLVYGSAALPGLFLLPLTVAGLHAAFGLGHSAPYIAGALVTGITVIYGFFGHRHFSFRTAAGDGQHAA